MIYLLLVLVSTTGQVIEYEPYNETDLPNPAHAITRDDKGQLVEVIVNRWHDSVYTPKGHKDFVFVQGYDYSKKQGFIRTYDKDNRLIKEDYSERYDGMVVREEMLEAFELFKQHPEVTAILAEQGTPVTLHGGFTFQDANPSEPCYRGNRCVHVFASTSKKSVAAHAIVKLSDKSVPYPAYDTDEATHAVIEQRMRNIRNQRGEQ